MMIKLPVMLCIRFIIIFSLCLVISNCVIAQVNPGFSTDVRIDKPHTRGRFITDFAGDRLNQAYLFRDIDLSTYELLAVNLSFTDKDQVQKINFQPFRLMNIDNNLLNSIKLNIVQKKDITTFGIGIGGDYSDPLTNRAKNYLSLLFDTAHAAPPPVPVDSSRFVAVRDSIMRLDDSLGLRPLLLKFYVDDPIARLVEKSESDYKKTLQAFKTDVLDSLLLDFDEYRARSIFKWTVGYNRQYFSILSANGKANDFDSLNYHGTKADVFSAAVSYSYGIGCINFSAGYNYIRSRKDAVKPSENVDYDGYAFSISKRVIRFLSGSRLRRSDAYKKSLFIPSVLLGASWELKSTSEGNFIMIEEGIKRSRVLTFMVDILISPVAQFRIGLPVQKNTLVGGEKLNFLGANVQYSLKFSSLQ